MAKIYHPKYHMFKTVTYHGKIIANCGIEVQSQYASTDAVLVTCKVCLKRMLNDARRNPV